ncbi:hypothetical protein EDD22DRAFT_853349 [Suillus occidentalis]|nr:hypothetical protein EDD22DRAFT_853349 [Suillus occidentalis]
MAARLNIFLQDKKIYTSVITSFLPNKIPFEPVWNSWDNHDSSLDDSNTPLTTRWAYESPEDSTSSTGTLGKSGKNWNRSYFGVSSFWALDSWFHVIAAVCSWHIMTYLLTGVLCTGCFISPMCYPWELQLPMFKHFSIPIWVHYRQSNAVFDMKLCHYIPSSEVIACTLLEAKTLHNDIWGTPDADTHNETALGWDDPMQGQTTSRQGPTPQAPEVDLHFPAPQRLSGQKLGEDWKTFFAQYIKENQKKEEKESPAHWQSHKSWE